MDNPKEIVYPFDGQFHIYLDPPVENGRVKEGAALFRAVTQIRPALREEILQLQPREVFITHVPTWWRYHGAPTHRARFSVGTGLKSTSLISKKKDHPRFLTVQVNPQTLEPLLAWEMESRKLVYPTSASSKSGISQHAMRIKKTLFEEPVGSRRWTNAAKDLLHWGHLAIAPGVTTEKLRDLLLEYHLEIFDDVASDSFFNLAVATAERYPSQPDQFWLAVYGPLSQAEQMPPAKATLHLQAALDSLDSARSVAAGMEEPTRHSLYYDQKKVTVRLLDALLAFPSLKDLKFFDPKTGKVTPTTAEAAHLLGDRPTPEAMRSKHKTSGIRFFQEINRYLTRRKSTPPEVAQRLDVLARLGAVEIRIGPPRQVDLRPWPEKRIRQVVARAKKARLSFNPTVLEYGLQSETALGRQLKNLYGQVMRTDNLPQYGKRWPNLLLAHKVPLEKAYGVSGPPKAREIMSVFVDLERDEKGLPIPDQSKHIADVKDGRLASLWKNPRVQNAKTVFILGIQAHLSERGGVLFTHAGHRHQTNIPRKAIRPEKPLKLAIEIAVADPYHAVQVARRMDTGKIVYPFTGQIRFYLDAAVMNGRIPEDAFLYRAVNVFTKSLIKKIGAINPTSVHITYVPTFLRSGPRKNRAQFSVKPGVVRATSLRYSKKRPPLLTVRTDPKSGMPLEAWRMGGGRPVFPRDDHPPIPVYQIFVDAPKDEEGLVQTGILPDLEVSIPVWETVWGKVLKPGAKIVTVQGFHTHDLGKKVDRLTFYFESEQYLTSIPASSADRPLLQVDFRADDQDRRPQEARRMDKPREPVYPGGPDQKRIWIDPKLEKGRPISGFLYKAGSKLDSETVKAALKKARRQVVFENLSTASEHGRVSFWDPVHNKRVMTSLPYQPGVLVNVVMKRPNGGWPLQGVHDASWRDISFRSRTDSILADFAILRVQKRHRAPVLDRVEAADRLFHLGALTTHHKVTTAYLHDLLLDYHRDIFGDVAAEAFFGLANVAADKYLSKPDVFWQAVYVPLREAEGMPAKDALDHIQKTRKQLVAAGMEETPPQRLGRIARQMQAQGWIESAGRFRKEWASAWFVASDNLEMATLVGDSADTALWESRRQSLSDFIGLLEQFFTVDPRESRIHVLNYTHFNGQAHYYARVRLETDDAPLTAFIEMNRRLDFPKLSVLIPQRGQFRIGRDADNSVVRPLIHLDIHDRTKTKWWSHRNMVPVWSSGERKPLDAFSRFQERMIGRIQELAQRDLATAGAEEEIRRFDTEGFATRFPEQAKRVPAGAGRIAVIPEGTVFRLYRPETLASGVEEWAAAHRSELPGVEIRAESIPARLFQVERLAVFLWDPMLGPLPYEPSVPVVRQWAGQPIPYRADGLFGLALWGPGATPTHLIAAWTFKREGRTYLAIAVSA